MGISVIGLRAIPVSKGGGGGPENNLKSVSRG